MRLPGFAGRRAGGGGGYQRGPWGARLAWFVADEELGLGVLRRKGALWLRIRPCGRRQGGLMSRNGWGASTTGKFRGPVKSVPSGTIVQFAHFSEPLYF